MTFKTVLACPIFSSSAEDRGPSDSLVRYAIEFAAAQGAHLSVALGCIRLFAPAAIMVGEARALIAKANEERRLQAKAYGDTVLAQARAEGVVASLDLAQEDYGKLCSHMAYLARFADVTIMEADAGNVSLHQGILEEVLFESGRPLIIVPPTWSGPADVEKVIISWDGSAKAARALGDAVPLLGKASEVEIVSVSGDADASKRMEAAEIAPHVSRHCKKVTVTGLPAQNSDVAATLASHAKMSRADLLVMGAFARPKLRQLILGGVTRNMLTDPPCPVMLSY